jgi:hypothetical protein
MISWSYADHRLWVLDEVDAPKGKLARLYRVEPYLGLVKLVGKWPRLGLFDELWLGLDHDGQVLLAASSTKLDKHAIVRLEAKPYDTSAPLRLSMHLGNKALAAPPLVHAAGYSLALRSKSDKIDLARRKHLDLKGCLLAELAQVL